MSTELQKTQSYLEYNHDPTWLVSYNVSLRQATGVPSSVSSGRVILVLL